MESVRASSDTSLGVFTLGPLSISITAAQWRGPWRRPVLPTDVTHDWIFMCAVNTLCMIDKWSPGHDGSPPAADGTALRLILNRNVEEFKSSERCYNDLFKTPRGVFVLIFTSC